MRAGAEDVVRAALADLGPELLLALPGLAEVDVVVDGVQRILTASPLPASRAGTTSEVELRDGERTTTWRVLQRPG
ncbi:hypothetical protein, partial [Staphylococcus aureus]|uniref:hypothetical protein n=1 Tax=Staphylococcus aureus TaxID=1280 RepID=UPI001CF34FCF